MKIDNMNSELWTREQQRNWLLFLVAGTTLLYASRSCIPLLMPPISIELRWNKSESGIILSSFFWGYALTQFLGGYIADRVGGEKVILLAAVGWSLVTVSMPFFIEVVSSDAGIHLILIRIAHGAFQGMHFPGMSSLSSKQLTEKSRASFFSVAASGSACGIVLTGTLGSFLLEKSNWQTVFYVIGGTCCLWAYLFFCLCNTSRNTLSSHGYNRNVPWKTLLRQPALWSCIFAHACQNNCFFILLSWLPTYFHDTFPRAKGWLVNMTPWLFIIPCTFLGKWLSELLLLRGLSLGKTRKVVEAMCLLTQAFGFLALDHMESLTGVLICLVSIVGASGFHNSAVIVNPGDLAPNHSGSVFGLMNTVGSISGFVSVYAVGIILQKTQSWSTVFNLIAFINIIGCLVFSFFASGNPIIK